MEEKPIEPIEPHYPDEEQTEMREARLALGPNATIEELHEWIAAKQLNESLQKSNT